MACDEGKLMAYLDEELTSSEIARLEEHLQSCPACREKLPLLKEQVSNIKEVLGYYQQALEKMPVQTANALQRLKNYEKTQGININQQSEQQQASKRKEWWKLSKYKKAVSWVAAAALVVGIFGFTPAKSVAAQFLSIFRVDRVKVLHFDPADFEELNKAMHNQGKVNLDNFGRIETQPQGKFQQVAPAEVAEKVDFQVKLPAALGKYKLNDEIWIEPGNKVTITPDVKGLNAFLKDTGSKKLLPAELDGKPFTIDIPTVIRARYLDETGKEFKDLDVIQAPAPQITAPAGVDVTVIRDTLLAVPILPENLKQALASINNWQNTMIVPDFGGTAREVTVNGTEGVFVTPPKIEKADSYQPPSTLAWPQNGTWLAIHGNLTLDQALELAQEFK